MMEEEAGEQDCLTDTSSAQRSRSVICFQADVIKGFKPQHFSSG